MIKLAHSRRSEENKMNKKMFKKSAEELQEYMKFRRHGWATEIKKGKGSKYNRAKEKNNNKKEEW